MCVCACVRVCVCACVHAVVCVRVLCAYNGMVARGVTMYCIALALVNMSVIYVSCYQSHMQWHTKACPVCPHIHVHTHARTHAHKRAHARTHARQYWKYVCIVHYLAMVAVALGHNVLAYLSIHDTRNLLAHLTRHARGAGCLACTEMKAATVIQAIVA